MEFKGIITEISEIKTGKTKKGEDWASIDFEVTESEPNNPDYPQIALFSYFKSGDYYKYANEFKNYFDLKDEVLVEFNFKCNKYTKKDGSGEGKFYKNDCWRVQKTSETVEDVPMVDQPGTDKKDNDDSGLPF